MSVLRQAGCPLCDAVGGELVAAGSGMRVIRATEPSTEGFPAFYRVVWDAHVAELSDLSADERNRCMDVVVRVEHALRTALPEGLRPDKINLAAFGNMVPHLHWHVIARYRWDSHFPSPVWAVAVHAAPQDRIVALQAALPAVEASMKQSLAVAGLR